MGESDAPGERSGEPPGEPSGQARVGQPARFVVTPEAAFASVPGGGVVLHLGANRYFQLNETATVIWELLDRGLDVDAIAAELTTRFEIGPADAARAVEELVGRLREAGLIAPAPGPEA